MTASARAESHPRPSLASGVQPPTSTLNFPTGDNRANRVTVPLGAGGKLDVVHLVGELDGDRPGHPRRHRLFQALERVRSRSHHIGCGTTSPRRIRLQ